MSVKKISQLNSLASNEVTSSIDLLAIVDTTNTETKKITVDNLLSGGNYSVSGSFSGSFQGDGSGITGVTGEWDGSHNGNASITGSLTVTGIISSSSNLFGDRIVAASYIQTPVVNSATNVVRIDDSLNVVGQITASGDISSSTDVYGVTGSFLHLLGDGSQLTGVESEWDGTLNGNGEITGSLVVTGDITGSNISASNTVYGITGSFSHLLGSSPLTVESDNFNIDSSGNITSSANISASGDLYGDNLIVGNDATFDGNITQLAGSGTTQTIANAGGVSTTNTTLTTVATLELLLFKINTFNVKVQCKDQANSDNGGYWNLVGTFSRGLAVNQIGTTTILASHEWDGSLDVNLNIVGTNVEVQVNGLTGTNITWYCTYDRISMI